MPSMWTYVITERRQIRIDYCLMRYSDGALESSIQTFRHATLDCHLRRAWIHCEISLKFVTEIMARIRDRNHGSKLAEPTWRENLIR